MKKFIYYILGSILCCCAVSCNNSEYSLDKLVPDSYHKIVYFKNSGIDSLQLYTTDSLYKDSLVIIKAGSDPGLTADMKVIVLTQADVDSIYNNIQGTNYQVLPTDAYSFDNGQEVSFNKNEIGKYLSVSINTIKMYAQEKINPNVKWVLPLQLVSAKKDSVNTELDKSIQVINVKCPTITFQNTNQQAEMIYKSLDINLPMNVTYCPANKWNFTCSLDETKNDSLVAAYNADNGTSYDKMPDGSYTIDGLEFAQGLLQDTAKVSINRAGLQNDHTYLLPLKLSDTSMGDKMQVSPTIAYLVVSNPTYGIVQPGRGTWAVLFCNSDNAMSGSSSDNAGPYAILDNNVNTYWHSNYNSTDASDYQQNGHQYGDDYDYLFSDYNAFLGQRNANQVVIVLDMQTAKHLVGVGITQRQNTSYRDTKSCDIYVSNDAAFNFKPLDQGGTLTDYNAVALNNWTKLCSVTVPQQNETYWQYVNTSILQSGGIKGRFVKIQFTGSYRSNVLNMTEFQVLELLSINGEAVE